MNAREVILAVMHEVQGVGKNERNSAQGFNFRGIDAVINKVGPALRKAGGFILPEVKQSEHSIALTAKGSQVNVVHLVVQFGIYGLDGEAIVGTVAAEAMDSGDKSTNKALSCAYKMMAFQTFCIPTEGDNDADGTTHEVSRQASKIVFAPAPPNTNMPPQPPREAGDLPDCPTCATNTAVIKSKPQYGGGYVCWTGKQGCGAKFNTMASSLPTPNESPKQLDAIFSEEELPF